MADFNNPFKEEELEPETSVSIMYPFDDGKPPVRHQLYWCLIKLLPL